MWNNKHPMGRDAHIARRKEYDARPCNALNARSSSRELPASWNTGYYFCYVHCIDKSCQSNQFTLQWKKHVYEYVCHQSISCRGRLRAEKPTWQCAHEHTHASSHHSVDAPFSLRTSWHINNNIHPLSYSLSLSLSLSLSPSLSLSLYLLELRKEQHKLLVQAHLRQSRCHRLFLTVGHHEGEAVERGTLGAKFKSTRGLREHIVRATKGTCPWRCTEVSSCMSTWWRKTMQHVQT